MTPKAATFPIPEEGVAKGLRGLKGRKGRKGQEALRKRFWVARETPEGNLASLTSLTLSTFSTPLRHPLKGRNMPAQGAAPDECSEAGARPWVLDRPGSGTLKGCRKRVEKVERVKRGKEAR